VHDTVADSAEITEKPLDAQQTEYTVDSLPDIRCLERLRAMRLLGDLETQAPSLAESVDNAAGD